jgi:hypothetical protein
MFLLSLWGRRQRASLAKRNAIVVARPAKKSASVGGSERYSSAQCGLLDGAVCGPVRGFFFQAYLILPPDTLDSAFPHVTPPGVSAGFQGGLESAVVERPNFFRC